ncbi:MAG TPA: FtsX-like permease family protein, partial [Terriglobales bacterium]|nr:FtsX-like permease family protein [Terriglobales bacterium]
WQARANYFDQLRNKIASLPQVVAIGISTNATPPDNGWEQRFEISGKPSVEQQRSRVNFVSPEYFSVLHIPLLQGRLFDQSEISRGARLAIINETMAHQYFPNGDALGSQIRVPELKGEAPFNLTVPQSDSWLQVVGIVGDVRDDGLSKPIKPEFYIPYTVIMPVWTQFLVRTQGEPLSILRQVRLQIQSVDPDQQTFHEVRSLEQWITNQQEYAREHMIAFLFAIFGVLALGLAAVGLYSVVSYSVAQRTGEFGIRIALGAVRKDVLLMVFQSAATSVGLGVLTGLIAVIALNRVLSSWIQGSSRSPMLLLGVSVLMLAVAGLACLLPARRASSIDPMEALRYE